MAKKSQKQTMDFDFSGVTLGDLEALMLSMKEIAKSGPRRDETLDEAHELIFQAWESDSPRKRLALAHKALKISPLCSDAYLVLAEDAAASLDEKIAYYRKAVDAGEKALGETCFAKDAGRFWLLIETRPYMRAKEELANALWESGSRDEAVIHYRDMIRLNPNDNQGMRHLLLDCLLELGREDEALKLIRSYSKDIFTGWHFGKALALFRSKGDCAVSRKSLAKAVAGNPFVLPLLTGKAEMPGDMPEFYQPGGEDEAIVYASHARPAWQAAPAALDWLRGHGEAVSAE